MLLPTSIFFCRHGFGISAPHARSQAKDHGHTFSVLVVITDTIIDLIDDACLFQKRIAFLRLLFPFRFDASASPFSAVRLQPRAVHARAGIHDVPSLLFP